MISTTNIFENFKKSYINNNNNNKIRQNVFRLKQSYDFKYKLVHLIIRYLT